MRDYKRALIYLLVMALVFGLTAVCWGKTQFGVLKREAPKDGPAYAAGEFLAKFRPGVPEKVVRQTNQQHGVSVLEVSPRGKFLRLRVPQGKTVEQMVAVYAKNPHVEYAEPNYLLHAALVPNDSFYSYQWHLDNGVYGGIGMEAAWDLEPGKASVIVAVVDTGVAYEDFGAYKKAPDLAQTSFVPGKDIINNDDHPNDDNGHGTHVTGTVAQSTDNVEGVAGVAFGTSIMPVKVLDQNGSGSTSAVANGIYFAADHGAHVINLSLGSTRGTTTLQNACSYAYQKGVTLVCAAGNNGRNQAFYPAAYNDYCIAVGATRYDETRAYYSNYGSFLDLVAPGGDLNVDQNGDFYGDGVLQQTFSSGNPTDFGYWFYQGTSMATPHVAGVAALLIASGVTGPDNVRQALESTAKDLGAAGWDQYYGWGRVDAEAALLANQPVLTHDVAVTGITATPSTVVVGGQVTVDVTVANFGDYDDSFNLVLTDTTSNNEIGTRTVSLSSGATGHVETFTWDTTGASFGVHSLEGKVVLGTDSNSGNDSQTTQVTVQEAKHDVAVSAVNAPASAAQGDVVTISVTVQNLGTYSESVEVKLEEGTSQIGETQTTNLEAGATATLNFTWDTAGAASGNHDLTATATIAVDNDLTNNTRTAVVTITDPDAAATMHVAGIDMGYVVRSAGKNKFYKAFATVSVVDANNAAVPGATVAGTWSGATSETLSGTTDTSGKVTIYSSEVKNPKSGTTFNFRVDSITKSGWQYDAGTNFETSDSITLP
jgi:serine protease